MTPRKTSIRWPREGGVKTLDLPWHSSEEGSEGSENVRMDLLHKTWRLHRVIKFSGKAQKTLPSIRQWEMYQWKDPRVAEIFYGDATCRQELPWICCHGTKISDIKTILGPQNSKGQKAELKKERQVWCNYYNVQQVWSSIYLPWPTAVYGDM